MWTAGANMAMAATKTYMKAGAEAAKAGPKWIKGTVKAGAEFTKGVVGSYKGVIDTTAENMKSVVDTATSLSAPLYPYLAPKDGKQLTDALQNWTWGSVWFTHMWMYHYLFWQMRWYMYNYWTTLGYPQTKEAASKLADYWAGVWKTYASNFPNGFKATAEVAKHTADVVTSTAGTPKLPSH